MMRKPNMHLIEIAKKKKKRNCRRNKAQKVKY